MIIPIINTNGECIKFSIETKSAIEIKKFTANKSIIDNFKLIPMNIDKIRAIDNATNSMIFE
jgi:hypothetical protein